MLQPYRQGRKPTVSRFFSLVMVSMLDDCCRFDNSSSVGVTFASFDRGRAIWIRNVGVHVRSI
jgi:hypothetical protein